MSASDCRSSEVIGFEAMGAVAPSGGGGFVPPGDFIPLAESKRAGSSKWVMDLARSLPRGLRSWVDARWQSAVKPSQGSSLHGDLLVGLVHRLHARKTGGLAAGPARAGTHRRAC